MSPIKLGVCGASGRSGGEVVRLALSAPAYQLTCALVSSTSVNRGRPVSLESGALMYTDDKVQAVNSCDGFIDFSAPEASMELLRLCAQKRRPTLIATTGHTNEQLAEIHQLAKDIPILLSANTSLGIFALTQAARVAQQILGDDYEIEVFELHHKHKRDAPSGTAKSIASALVENKVLSAVVRSQDNAIRSHNQIGISSLRGGEVPGEHTIFFLGQHERLELIHRASSRALFADGALNLLKRLMIFAPGVYSMEQMFQTKVA